ncbi:MAG: nickel pincer cofactor biosynthesis protein LarC [Phycisphaerales bacterium]|nr:nickel pincer cofactor biosynthesis protein LarC [Phycisphaerales bacterium]
MRIAYADCFSGCAGDMFLAALIDAGAPLDALREVVGRLALPGVELHADEVKRGGIRARHVRVEVGAESRKAHRHLHHVVAIMDAAGLAPRVAERARAVFSRLAEAEAAVHGTTIQKVHFHEVGAADAIVDIVCTCAALDMLGVGELFASAVPTGNGTVRCEHGIMPVPAPATARLLERVPLAPCEEEGELTTPTGAALLTTLASGFGPIPAMTISSQGWGAGTREGKTRPNVMRVLIGECSSATQPKAGMTQDTVLLLEANLDDASGQICAFALERALEAGALDAWAVPIMMKKGRPGLTLGVLCRPADAGRLEALLLTETPTLGVRRSTMPRTTLARRSQVVSTRFGEIRVKIAVGAAGALRAAPEYEDCAAAARRHGVPLADVQQAALRSWQDVNDRNEHE